jgi:hypothetical protein
MTKDLSRIPAGACLMSIGEFIAGDNGETAKSAPVRLKARSGQPIEHWYWGNVVHDLSGMKLAKGRLAIDYVHDPKEIIGYLNKFDATSGDLFAEGALVPFKDSDRATEIIHKMREGVPYEASINFGGDGIKVQELAEGEVTEVNGYRLEGPAAVIREWPLRGVAICPYGADQNTESATFSESSKTYTATAVAAPKPENHNDNQEKSMSNEEAVVQEEAATPSSEPIEELKTNETVEAAAEEGTSVLSVEAQPAAEEPKVSPEEMSLEQIADAIDPRAEFARMKDEFGAEIAAEVFAAGGDYASAQKLAFERLKAANEDLKAQLASKSGGSPAAFVPQDKKAKTFKDLFVK